MYMCTYICIYVMHVCMCMVCICVIYILKYATHNKKDYMSRNSIVTRKDNHLAEKKESKKEEEINYKERAPTGQANFPAAFFTPFIRLFFLPARSFPLHPCNRHQRADGNDTR